MPQQVCDYAFVHGARLHGGAARIFNCRIGPVAGIPRLNGPFGQLREVRLLPLHRPAVWEEIAQCIQIVPEWEWNLLRRERAFERLLCRLLRKSAHVARDKPFPGKQRFGPVEIFPGEA